MLLQGLMPAGNARSLSCRRNTVLYLIAISPHAKVVFFLQLVAAVISAAVKNDGDRGWTSFVLLIVELNIIVWVSLSLLQIPPLGRTPLSADHTLAG